MCMEAIIDGKRYDTPRALMADGFKLEPDDDYAGGIDPDCCLCQIDQPETARLNGYEARLSEGYMDWVWEKQADNHPNQREA